MTPTTTCQLRRSDSDKPTRVEHAAICASQSPLHGIILVSLITLLLKPNGN